MSVKDHLEKLKTDPRYAELVKDAETKYKAYEAAMLVLSLEYPLDEGHYSVFGVDEPMVRPTTIFIQP